MYGVTVIRDLKSGPSSTLTSTTGKQRARTQPDLLQSAYVHLLRTVETGTPGQGVADSRGSPAVFQTYPMTRAFREHSSR